MGLYNPKRLHMNSKGQMVDKWGRVHTFEPDLHRKARSPLHKGGRVSVSYFSHKPSGNME